MPRLNEVIKPLVQRTLANEYTTAAATDPSNFSSRGASNTKASNQGLSADIANLVFQWNRVGYVLFNSLPSADGINALDFGLAGNAIFTHVNANAASAPAYYNAGLARPKTIKETFDTILAQIAALQTPVTIGTPGTEYDDTALRSMIRVNQFNLDQIRKDTFGRRYSYDADGEADRDYPLAQHLDALGSFFDGYPGSGNTYTDAYPALSLNIALSDLVIDTTIPQSGITNLTSHLNNIRTFIGMNTATSTPLYSAHGAVGVVTDGDSLELAIQKLDAEMTSFISSGATLQSAFDGGHELTIATSTGHGVVIVNNDNTSEAAIKITTNASKPGLKVLTSTVDSTQAGIDVVIDSTGGKGMSVRNSTNTSIAAFVDTRSSGANASSSTAYFLRNLPSASTNDAVVKILNNHASDDQNALYVSNLGIGYAIETVGSVKATGSGEFTVSVNSPAHISTYSATVPVASGSGYGIFWSRNDGRPIWTNQAGTDFDLSLAGAHASTHIRGGSDAIDGDQLDITFNPSFYTPNAAAVGASHVDHLAAHLSGIDAALAAAGTAGGETLAQTLIIGNTTSGNDIVVTNGDSIVGAAGATNASGATVRVTGGAGNGTGDGGYLLFVPGAKGASGADGRIGLFTSTPDFAIDFDTTGLAANSGMAIGNAYIGDDSTGSKIAHRGLAASSTGYSLKISNAGELDINAPTGQDINFNIQNSSVGKINVDGWTVTSRGSEPVGENGTYYYSTALSKLRVKEAGSWYPVLSFVTDGGVTSNKVGNLGSDDFVFGASTLSSVIHAKRFQFNKAKGGFRAGSVTGIEWNDAQVGEFSVGFGSNTVASGQSSAALGGSLNVASGTGALVGAGTLNNSTATNSAVLGGNQNTASANNAGIVTGESNTASGSLAFVGAGQGNTASGSSSAITAGTDNVASANNTFVGSGQNNSVTVQGGAIVAGGYNEVDSRHSMIGAGRYNIIEGDGFNFIGAGGGTISADGNKILGTGPAGSFIGSGVTNAIQATLDTTLSAELRTIDIPEIGAPPEYALKHQHVIGGGFANEIINTNMLGGELGFIGGGGYNQIDDTLGEWHGSAIVGGFNNRIQGNRYNFIGNGYENIIHQDASSNISNYSAILSGRQNTIDGASHTAIVNGRNNTVTADYVTVLGSKDQNVSTYGAVHQSAFNTGTYRQQTLWSGTVTNDSGFYFLSLNDPGVAITSFGSNEDFSTNESEGLYWFEGEFIGHLVSASSTNVFLHGNISGYGWNDGTTFTWINRVATGKDTATTNWLASGGVIEWVHSSGNVRIRVQADGGETNGVFTVDAKIIHKRTFNIV